MMASLWALKARRSFLGRVIQMGSTMRKHTGKSRGEQIRNDFDYDATDLNVIELGCRLTEEKRGCKPNKPPDFISRSQLALAICLFA
jgi:hypothetical protein